MERVIVDMIGALSTTAIIWLLFSSFLKKKKTWKSWFIVGVILFIILNVIFLPFFFGDIFLPVIQYSVLFLFSFSFKASLGCRLLFSLLTLAILFLSDVFITLLLGNIVNPAEEMIFSNKVIYFIAVTSSNMIAFLVVLVLRIVFSNTNKIVSEKYNFILLIMPIQSVIVCYIVFISWINRVIQRVLLIEVLAISLSLALVCVTFVIVKELQKSIEYKIESALSKEKLYSQIELHKQLYIDHEEIRKIKHEMINNLIAITGLLRIGELRKGIDRLENITSNVLDLKSLDITGVAELDAIIYAKIKRAEESQITISTKFRNVSELHVDAFDLAGIIANALDNAIEGILRSNKVEKAIDFQINVTGKHVNIIVINYANGFISETFASSKDDKVNHGFGMAHMRKIVEKYSGDFIPFFDGQINKFTLSIRLNNTKNAHSKQKNDISL